MLIETRTLIERLQAQEGGGRLTVITLGLGGIAFALGLVKMLWLFVVGRKVAAQKKTSTPDTSNPLGRILAVAKDNPEADREQLELMLDEVVLREVGQARESRLARSHRLGRCAAAGSSRNGDRYDPDLPVDHPLRCR